MQCDWEQILCFLEVARLMSFTHAADVLYTTQPAVSRKVAALEAQLGIALLRRGRRELQLTAAGEDFCAFFREMSAKLDALRRRHTQDAAGRIAFGVFHGCDLLDRMGNFIAEFQRTHPNAILRGNSGNMTQLIEGLRLGRFDFAVGIKKAFLAQAILAVEELCTVHRVVVFARENPLAGKKDLSLRDFADQPYYAFIEERGAAQLMTNQDLFAAYGFSPDTRMLDNMDSVIMALKQGTGFVLLDERQRILGNTAFCHFLLPETETLSLAYPEELPKDSLPYRFIRALCDEFRAHL